MDLSVCLTCHRVTEFCIYMRQKPLCPDCFTEYSAIIDGWDEVEIEACSICATPRGVEFEVDERIREVWEEIIENLGLCDD